MSHWQGWLYVAAVLVPLLAFLIERLAGRWLRHRCAYLATAAIGISCALSVVGFFLYLAASNGMPAHPRTDEHTDDATVVAAVPIAADLRSLREDPGATVWAWIAGRRRQVWDGGVSVFNPGDGSTSRLEAEQLVMVRPLIGGGSDTALAFGTGPVRLTSLETAKQAKRRPGIHPEPIAWTGSWDWVSLAGGTAPPIRLPIGIRIDNLAVLMFLMVTSVAFVVHLYATEYMRGDPYYHRFFSYLSLFCFSMLGLLAAASLFWVFVFWELVGLCSYLLIGFWSDKKANTDAANKAFVTNRIGDVGMLVGLGLIWTSLGTLDLAELNRSLRDETGHLNLVMTEDGATQVERRDLGEDGTLGPVIDRAKKAPFRVPLGVLTVAGLGVFAGCMGKSAQFPLHVWLPDAMAGPTPVSALIHAATMVAAGVYLVGRAYGLFTAEAMLVIAYVGGTTLFLAATIAMVQTDYKKVLAYSTVSQLGFMMLGLGVGGWAAGLFHLLTHAGFKALLFLGAGSVHHAVHTYEMTELGGLYPKMRATARTMFLATMAISGVPLLSGFYSKDAVLAAAFWFVRRHPEHAALLILPVVGALLTAFYMFRMWFLLFTGPARGDKVAHAHESPWTMVRSLVVLAVPTVVAGWPLFVVPFSGEPIVEGWLLYGEPVRGTDFAAEHFQAFAASLIVATLGIGLGLVCYGPLQALRWVDPARMAGLFWPVHLLLKRKYFLDEIYQALLMRPVLGLARLASGFDRWVIDGLVDGLARSIVRLSRWEGAFDIAGVDGLVNLFGRACYVFGDQVRRLQFGRLRGYLMVLGLAVVALCVGLALWVQG